MQQYCFKYPLELCGVTFNVTSLHKVNLTEEIVTFLNPTNQIQIYTENMSLLSAAYPQSYLYQVYMFLQKNQAVSLQSFNLNVTLVNPCPTATLISQSTKSSNFKVKISSEHPFTIFYPMFMSTASS